MMDDQMAYKAQPEQVKMPLPAFGNFGSMLDSFRFVRVQLLKPKGP